MQATAAFTVVIWCCWACRGTATASEPGWMGLYTDGGPDPTRAFVDQVLDTSPRYKAATGQELHAIITSMNGQNVLVVITDDITLGSEWSLAPVVVQANQTVVVQAELMSDPDVSNGTQSLLAAGALRMNLSDTPGAFVVRGYGVLAFFGIVFQSQPSPGAYEARFVYGTMAPSDMALYPAVLPDVDAVVVASEVSVPVLKASCTLNNINTMVFVHRQIAGPGAEVGVLGLDGLDNGSRPLALYSDAFFSQTMFFINTSNLACGFGADHILLVHGPEVDRCLVDSYYLPSAPTNEDDGFESWYIGLIVGCATVGLLAVAWVGAIFWRRWRRQRALQQLFVPGTNGVLLAGLTPGQLELDLASHVQPGAEEGKGSSEINNIPSTLNKGSTECAVDLALPSCPLAAALDLRFESVMARRASAVVWRGAWHGTPVAIKVNYDEQQAQALEIESDLLQSLSHPNLVSIYLVRRAPLALFTKGRVDDGRVDAVPDPHPALIVMELCDRGSLRDVVDCASRVAGEQSDALTPQHSNKLVASASCCADVETEARDEDAWPAYLPGDLAAAEPGVRYEAVLRLLMDVGAGLDYLHSCGVVHHGLCAGSVLLTSAANTKRGYRAKLGDLGCPAPSPGRRVSSPVDPGPARAPELADGHAPTSAADVYAFGVLMWHAWMLHPAAASPWVASCATGEDPAPDITQQPTADLPRELLALAEQCCALDVAARPSAHQILLRLRELLTKHGQHTGAMRKSAGDT